MRPPRFHIKGKFSAHEVQSILAVYRQAARKRYGEEFIGKEHETNDYMHCTPQLQTLKKLQTEVRRINSVYEEYLRSRRVPHGVEKQSLTRKPVQPLKQREITV